MLKVSQVIEQGLIRTQESLNSKFMVFVLPFPPNFNCTNHCGCINFYSKITRQHRFSNFGEKRQHRQKKGIQQLPKTQLPLCNLGILEVQSHPLFSHNKESWVQKTIRRSDLARIRTPTSLPHALCTSIITPFAAEQWLFKCGPQTSSTSITNTKKLRNANS